MKIIEKVMKDTGKNYKRLIRDYCPEKFGYKNCMRVSGSCSMSCEECWNREVEVQIAKESIKH